MSIGRVFQCVGATLLKDGFLTNGGAYYVGPVTEPVMQIEAYISGKVILQINWPQVVKG